MALSQHPTTMEKLPYEVLSDIFIRLLAKQLAQMRSVCKPWNALLSESSFIEAHLHRSIHNSNEVLLFFLAECGSYTAVAHPSSSPDLEFTNFIKLPFKTRCKTVRRRIIGSVNGLVCVSYTSYHDSILHLWNPSLSSVLTLPPRSSLSTFGFGYDPKTNDYKVVKLPSRFNMKPHAEVYSMRKGSWESISQRLPTQVIRLSMGESQFCLDGHIYWLCWINDSRKLQRILAFDVGAETFRVISLPDAIIDYDVYTCSYILRVLGGKLCVMSCARGGRCEVWVMDGYGLAESWVKHHAFPNFNGSIWPYGFTSCKEFLFRHIGSNFNDRLALYNPVASETKIITIKSGQQNSFISKVIEHVDSLVWITPAKRLRNLKRHRRDGE